MSHGNGTAWASPGPAALAALGVVATGFAFSMWGKVPVEGLPVLAAWIFGGFVVQFFTAIVELKDQHMTGGNVMLFFSAFFMLATALSMIAKFLMIKNGMKPFVPIEGYLWLSGGLFLLFLTPAYMKNSSALMFFMVCAVDLAIVGIVGMDTGWYGNPAVLKPIVGWILFLVGMCGNYMAGGSLVNAAFGKQIFPIPGPIIKG